MNAWEEFAFWAMGTVMVASALGMVLARKAVHCALFLATIMITLAIMYAAQGAPFLFAVQIIVYTGAILMLFLFVLMLVGVDSSDSIVETIKGQRLLAAFVGIVFGVVFAVAVSQTAVGTVVGTDAANEDGNVYGVAKYLFSDYMYAFELTGALLTAAVLAAMVLAHRERLERKQSQREMAQQRMADYADSGKHPGPLPTPGVFARHNANDTPALLPDGSISELSISRTLRARGTVKGALADDVNETIRMLDPEAPRDDVPDGTGDDNDGEEPTA
ncbi:NADH-quinone oxidoreductase subunit J [Solicola gregarius]|uniref:NADH-quinone oxidoreductase subunit J n=1 Tax=Solicola gregarius TaxID=2908642 RepID=A0AA46YJ09_9ACTN|nr:NADH-quinone oxidoreductase subunit J [Solicola gregarius]UYM03687.1 NADH-quinone oxidoreductase subunit J [Solicola gregarius]